MKLAGTSDTGWVAIDLDDVAAAIATVRASTAAARVRARLTSVRPPERSAVPRR